MPKCDYALDLERALSGADIVEAKCSEQVETEVEKGIGLFHSSLTRFPRSRSPPPLFW